MRRDDRAGGRWDDGRRRPGQMVNLVLDAFGHHGPSGEERSEQRPPGVDPDRAAHQEQIERLGLAAAASAFGAASPIVGSAFPVGRPGSAEISPQAWQALRYALARLAIDLVSGPAGVASILRRGLLEHPWDTPSLPLDIGYAESIPASIRRAVHWRDRYKCAWPRCGRPAAWSDVHHIKHRSSTATHRRQSARADRSGRPSGNHRSAARPGRPTGLRRPGPGPPAAARLVPSRRPSARKGTSAGHGRAAAGGGRR